LGFVKQEMAMKFFSGLMGKTGKMDNQAANPLFESLEPRQLLSAAWVSSPLLDQPL
jgi:hypothetical protein